MLKEIIISILVIVLIFTLDFFLQNYTKDSVEVMTGKLEILRENLLKKDEEAILNNMQDINNNWEDIQYKLSFFIEHNEIEKVKTNLVALEGDIQVKQYDVSISELHKSIFVLEHISDKYAFNLVNIF